MALAVGLIGIIIFVSRQEQDAGEGALASATVSSEALPVTVPYRESAGHIVIDVTLGDDSRTVPMIVDSGGPTIVSEEIAEVFGSGSAGSVSTRSANDELFSNEVVTLPRLSIGDAVFSDALNHASLIDGCRLSRADIHVYRHRDVDHLESLMNTNRGRARRALVLTDSVFSMDGVIAPLEDLARVARSHDAGLLVDEAHALGVLGPQGRGACAAAGIRPDVLIGTLGKAFGVPAGVIVAVR